MKKFTIVASYTTLSEKTQFKSKEKIIIREVNNIDTLLGMAIENVVIFNKNQTDFKRSKI